LQDHIGRVCTAFAHKLEDFDCGKTAKLFDRAGLRRNSTDNRNYCGSFSAGVLLVSLEPDVPTLTKIET